MGFDLVPIAVDEERDLLKGKERYAQRQYDPRDLEMQTEGQLRYVDELE